MANVVNLLVCRPHDENFRKLSPPSIEAPMPPLRLRSSFNFKQQQQYMNQFELPPGVRRQIPIFHFFFNPSYSSNMSLQMSLNVTIFSMKIQLFLFLFL